MKSITDYTRIVNVLPPQIRIIVFIIIIGVCFNLWHVALWSPLQHKKKDLSDNIAALTKEVSTMKQNIIKLQNNLATQQNNPEIPNNKFVHEKDQNINVAPPQEISYAVSHLFMAKYHLSLVNLSAYSSQKIIDSTTKTSVLEHAITIKFRGSYFSVLDYLKGIAELHWPIYWDNLEYTVTKYPDAEVTLQMRVLSS